MPPYDPNNPYFQYNAQGISTTPSANDAFAFNYRPQTLAQLSSNPNTPIAGAISPTLLAPNSFQTQPQQGQGQAQQQASPTQLPAPQLLNLGSTLLKQGTSVGQSLTNGVNQIGAQIGFANPSLITSGPSAATITADAGSLSGADASFLANAQSAAGFTDGTAGVASAASSLDATAASSQGIFGGATLSGTLGAAGLGAIGGGFLAKALGENPTGGSVGGALGAAAGYAFGGAGAAALGLELGSFAGPVGALVGGIGGAIFGGLFGGHSAPTSASSYGYSIGPTGNLTQTSYGSKNPSSVSEGFTQSANQNFSNIAQAASRALGFQYGSGVNFGAADSTLHGGPVISVTGPNGQSTGGLYFDSTNPQASQKAYLQALTAAAQYSGYTNTEALTNWYNNTYVNGTGGASNVPPTVPKNPTPNAQSDFQKFVQQYQAQQNANAA